MLSGLNVFCMHLKTKYKNEIIGNKCEGYKIYLAYRCYDLGDCAASEPSADELSESVSAHASQGKYHVFCILLKNTLYRSLHNVLFLL